MTPDHALLDALPAPLLEEFRAGRWLPIIGAGLSMGARNCPPPGMPSWEGLGEILGNDLPAGYSQGGAVEAISAYEHAYGRMRLTSRVIRALHVGLAKPDATQMAFAALSFEHVVTTNVEQLLEEAYRQVRGPVFTVVEDGQLRMANPYDSPILVKLHGDVHNPSTLVLTENDYDNVHLSRPLMLTWLAGQLITKTGILIGYSLGDPDVRGILASLRNGLGTAPPDLWVLTLGDNPVVAERYRRRGVRVATLPRTPEGWGILARLFEELLEVSRQSSSENISGTTSVVDAALKAGGTVDAFVLFLVHPDRLPLYTDFVFPRVVAAGLLPLSRADVRASQGFSVAATDNLLLVAGSVVVEPSAPDDASVLRAIAAVGEQRTLIVGAEGAHRAREALIQPSDNDPDAWLNFGDVLVAQLIRRRQHSTDQGLTGNSSGDLRTRTLVAVIDLESALRGLGLDRNELSSNRGQKFQPLRRLLMDAMEEGIFPELAPEHADEVVRIRNALVHGAGESVPETALRHALDRITLLLDQVRPYLADDVGHDASWDVESLLDHYQVEAPTWPHQELHRMLLEMDFVPHPAPPPRSYIRWVLTGGHRRLTLYQNETGLSVDSRVHRTAAARLPGAQQRGRRIVFDYQHTGIGQMRHAAEELRRLAFRE